MLRRVSLCVMRPAATPTQQMDATRSVFRTSLFFCFRIDLFTLLCRKTENGEHLFVVFTQKCGTLGRYITSAKIMSRKLSETNGKTRCWVMQIIGREKKEWKGTSENLIKNLSWISTVTCKKSIIRSKSWINIRKTWKGQTERIGRDGWN
jgi:hypothetical protein